MVMSLTTPTPRSSGGDARPHRGRERNRAAIVLAGLKLFEEDRLVDSSIEEIIASTGLAKATFYNHFADKEDLFAAIVEYVRKDQRDEILRSVEELDDPARHMARAFCVAFRYRLEHPGRDRVLERSAPPYTAASDPINSGIMGYVRDGLHRGRFILPSVEVGATAILGLMHSCSRATRSESGFVLLARAQQLGALMLRALGLSIAEADLIAAQEADIVFNGALFAPQDASE